MFIEGNYTQGDGGSLAIDVAGPEVGTQYDRLAVSGDVLTSTGGVDLAGTLTVTIADGSLPNQGDTFDVLTFETQNGGFLRHHGTTN